MKSARVARLLFQLPAESRVLRSINPQNNWGWSEVLLNKVAYFAEVLAWQNTKDAQKRAPRNKPKVYTPDFLIDKAKTSSINRDSETRTVEEIKAILAQPRV